MMAGIAACTALSGCGVQIGNGATNTAPTEVLSGRTMGGEQPVVGAVVQLYVTTTAAYGTGGTVVATTTSGIDGGFTFNPSSYTCPTGQYAYIVAAGGDPGIGSNNPQIVEMSALGPCGNLASFVNVDEVATTASAYALGNFMSLDTSQSTPVVHVSAPANNSSSNGTTTAAAGLAHAFANVNLLVNVTTGRANTTVPSAGPGGVTGIVPEAEINSIADVLQTCVNSNGGTTTGTNCGNLFALTPSLSGTTPTTTLQAAMNLAKNPWVNSTNSASIFALLPPAAAFQPDLSAAPSDWTVSVYYPMNVSIPNSNCAAQSCNSQTQYPINVTLDASDDAYVLTQNTNTSNQTGAGGVLYAFSSNGYNIYTNTDPISKSSSNTYGNGYLNAVVRNITAGPVGELWVGSASYTSGSSYTFLLNASTGAQVGSKFYGNQANPVLPAIDAAGNAYFSIAAGTAGTIQDPIKSPISTSCSGNTFALGSYCWGALAGVSTKTSLDSTTMAIDQNQNLWLAANGSGTNQNTIVVIPNTGSFASPTYPAASTALASTCAPSAGSAPTAPCSTTAGNGGSNMQSLAIDGSGNAWVITRTGTIGLNQVTANYQGGQLYNLTSTSVSGSSSYYTAPGATEVDGGSVVWTVDATKNGIIGYSSAATTPAFITSMLGLQPCRVDTSTYACVTYGTSSSALASPRGIAVDSTGSMWVNGYASASLIEMIGTANPTWPLLATGKPGVMPQ